MFCVLPPQQTMPCPSTHPSFISLLLTPPIPPQGDWSAYSLFNPGMRRLPGQMTAEQLDAQVRRGNM
mgnify:CR=1 FL=1